MGVSPLSRRSNTNARRAQQARAQQAAALRQGSRGANVKKTQERLQAHGYGAQVGSADGIYGPKTNAAVQAFQNDQIQSLTGRINSSTSDQEAIRLTQQKNGITQERDQGVAGSHTQALLNAAPASTTGLHHRPHRAHAGTA